MDFVAALQATLDTYRSRVTDLLSVYFLAPAIGHATRVVTLTGLAVVYAYLAATGRLTRLRADLRSLDATPPGPNADFEATTQWFEAVEPAFERLLTPEVLAALAVTLLAALVVFAGLYALVTAAQLACCWAALHDEWGTRAAVEGAVRHWRPLLGLLVLEVVALGVVTALAAAPVLAVGAASAAAGALLALLVGLLWLLAIGLLRIFFAFGAVAVVVDETGVAGAVRGAAGFFRGNPLSVAGYLVATVGTFALVGSASAASGSASGTVGTLLGFAIVSPLLDLLKTTLYGDHAASVSPPAKPEQSTLGRLGDGFRRCLGETRSFVHRHPGLHVVAALTLIAGGVVGWLVAGAYEGLVTASIESRIEGQLPPSAAAAYVTNNVTVAVGSAMSGLAVGVPAVVALLFNGALLGVLARLEVAPLVLAAFILPHGIIEIPAFVIAGALGLSLGGSGWRALRGRVTREQVAESLEHALRVLVGVAVLLAVAGVIEGFVSPYYFRPFLAL